MNQLYMTQGIQAYYENHYSVSTVVELFQWRNCKIEPLEIEI